MYRRGINWQARATAVLAMLTLDKAHLVFFGSPENTQLGVTIYQGTAALCNAISVVFFAHVLKGKLSYDLQRLAFCAILLNSFGWVLYMAQYSPYFINFLMSMVTYGMFTRVCWVSDNDTDSGGWRDFLLRAFAKRQKFYLKKANS